MAAVVAEGAVHLDTFWRVFVRWKSFKLQRIRAELKFIYSEKATKFCKMSTLLLTGCTVADSGFFKTICIKMAWSLQFLGYLRTLSLKFQKATTKIGPNLLKFNLNLRSSTTPETVALTPPWYQTWWNP